MMMMAANNGSSPGMGYLIFLIRNPKKFKFSGKKKKLQTDSINFSVKNPRNIVLKNFSVKNISVKNISVKNISVKKF